MELSKYGIPSRGEPVTSNSYGHAYVEPTPAATGCITRRLLMSCVLGEDATPCATEIGNAINTGYLSSRPGAAVPREILLVVA